MNPIDLIFRTLSVLTRGLITDVTTLVLGAVVLMFLGMAIDLLKTVLIDNYFADRRFAKFAKLHSELGYEGDAMDVVKAQKYKRLLRELHDYKGK